MYLLLPVILLVFLFLIVALVRRRYDDRVESDDSGLSTNPKYDYGHYQKKKYLLDTNSEFYFFCTVNEILGGKYYVFPQINYSHLIDIDNVSSYEQRRYRSHIERKSADFVICDKQTCVPRLVIDIDGSVHDRKDIKEKDIEIDSILTKIGLPIIRFRNNEVEDRELIRKKIAEKLNF